MRTLKFTELESGMLVQDGIITHVGDCGTNSFYGDSGFIYLISVHDPYYGQTARSVIPNEVFKVEYEKGSPEYKEIVTSLINERTLCLEDVQHDLQLLTTFLGEK